jgi:hypothetical protein
MPAPVLRQLKRWPLPPSLTPKRPRGMSRPEVISFDLSVCPAADGSWRCPECEAAYESRTGLFGHMRFCPGRDAAWACEWCKCGDADTHHRAVGPNGAKTLCVNCSNRFRKGAESAPQQNEAGDWVCTRCSRAFPSKTALSGHKRFCDGGAWRCKWCMCSAEDCSGKGPGPDGPGTLCAPCSCRFRGGQTGPPQRNDDGKYVCEKCGRLFDTIPGLGSHSRRCDGGAWRCGWCACSIDETSGKGPGPEGNSSLCSTCSSRFRAGHPGPPPTDANGRYPCENCERTFETFRALGVHGRDCDGGNWRCEWCDVKSTECSGKSPGPNGPRTLCNNCGGRFRSGATGPPVMDVFGLYPCELCGKQFETVAGLGNHRRHCRAAM